MPTHNATRIYSLLITLLLLVANVVMASETPARFKASVMVASPSEDTTQGQYGHAFFRMQYPDEGLDFCFTLEVINGNENPWNFITGDYKTQFMAIKTQDYLKQYAKDNRTVAQLPLNLTESEIQDLWRSLDETITNKAQGIPSNFFTDGCSAELMRILLPCIDGYVRYEPQVSDSIGKTSYQLTDTYRMLSSFSVVALSFVSGEKTLVKQEEDNLAFIPLAMPYMFSHAYIVKDGQRRPLLSANTVTVYNPDNTTQKRNVGNVYFYSRDTNRTVLLSIIAWLVVQIAVCLIFRRSVRPVSILMFVAYNVIVLVMLLAALQTSVEEFSGWKWQYLFYNPLPLLLWMANRKKPFDTKTLSRLLTALTAWAILCVAGFAVIRDMFCLEFTLIAASFALQLLFYKKLIRTKTNHKNN